MPRIHTHVLHTCTWCCLQAKSPFVRKAVFTPPRFYFWFHLSTCESPAVVSASQRLFCYAPKDVDTATVPWSSKANPTDAVLVGAGYYCSCSCCSCCCSCCSCCCSCACHERVWLCLESRSKSPRLFGLNPTSPTRTSQNPTCSLRGSSDNRRVPRTFCSYISIILAFFVLIVHIILYAYTNDMILRTVIPTILP